MASRQIDLGFVKGNDILTGESLPTSANEGDLFYKTDTNDFYQWSNGGWVKKGNTAGKAGIDGKDGTSAGFGTPTAEINGSTGTPEVTISTSGPDTAKVFKFTFTNLKGEKGDTGDKGEDGTITQSQLVGGDSDHPIYFKLYTFSSASYEDKATVTLTGIPADAIIDGLNLQTTAGMQELDTATLMGFWRTSSTEMKVAYTIDSSTSWEYLEITLYYHRISK